MTIVVFLLVVAGAACFVAAWALRLAGRANRLSRKLIDEKAELASTVEFLREQLYQELRPRPQPAPRRGRRHLRSVDGAHECEGA